MNNVLKINHNAGFFSCCTVRIRSIINFYNKYKIFPIVDSSEQWRYYKDKNEDVTSYFFKTTTDEQHFDNVNLTKSADAAQFSDYSKLNFNDIVFFVNKYFTLSDVVLNKQQELLIKYNIDFNNTIAIYYRGNDKHKETNIPTYDEILEKIKEIKQSNPGKKLLIQSDEIEFYDFILNTYPDAYYFKEVFKINKNQDNSVQKYINPEHRIEQAVIFLSILSILSKCNKVIMNSGNVCLWLCLFRNNTNGVYQYLNPKEYIYGVRTKNFKTPNSLWLG